MFFEVLEKRRLLSVSLNSAGVLTVTGTNLADLIRVGQARTTVSVHEGAKITNFPLAKVKKLVINGLGGDDSLLVSSNVTVPASINGGDGRDSITGGAGNDSLFGGAGIDTLRGFGGNDSLSGGDANDILDGGGGADTFSGGAGIDTVDYSSRSDNLTLKIGAGPVSGAAGEKDNILSDVENLTGGSGNDLLVGSSAPISSRAAPATTLLTATAATTPSVAIPETTATSSFPLPQLKP